MRLPPLHEQRGAPERIAKRDRLDVEKAVAAWMRWFNHTRLHSSIGYLPPVEFELHHATPKNAILESEAA